MSSDAEYEKLLQRVYEKLPYKSNKKESQELPALIINNIGSTTIIRNFSEYADRIRRDPKVLMKYLLKELAAAGTLTDNGALEIQGKFSSYTINNLIERFLNSYVRCRTCKSLDTILTIEKNVWTIKCLACGAITTVRKAF
ncbi:translation initiation factor IF-2 subunit beta [Sulfolobales archaeon HS-7]|nr:translation initiation factor IF-2 subunit beta [Sulfolobales archaeon HS-7]